MKLYSRDYNNLTNEEMVKWQQLKEEEIVHELGTLKIRKSKYSMYPKAVRHYLSLFPNNFLDTLDLKQEGKLNLLADKFLTLLGDETINERSILNFINENFAHFIIASILKGPYSFGHHGAFVFPEFQLGNSYQVDFLIVGKSSGGYEFVFVELEHPYKDIFLKDGHLGNAFRKGLNQITDWKRYLDQNFESLNETFEKYKNPSLPLPKEFLKRDDTRYHYVVVAGRRNHFSINEEKSYSIKRETLKDKNTLLLHYDNLYDSAKRIIGKVTY